MQLRQLPFTDVKTDRFFVSDAVQSADSRLIVKTIIDLAQGLGLTATAEGVETVEQLRLLRELRCDVVQGYLIAQPLEPTALLEWKQEFRDRWPGLIEDQGLALWSHLESDPLG